MTFPADQLVELQSLWPSVRQYPEAGITYFLFPDFQLPPGCSPDRMDLLLCPGPRDGYPCRVYFEKRVVGRRVPNWNQDGVRIIERNWSSYSWNIGPESRRLAQMVPAYLKGLL